VRPAKVETGAVRGRWVPDCNDAGDMATVGDVVARAVHGGDPANVDIGAAPPKSTVVERRTITGAAGTASTVDLYACDGAIGVTRLLGTGEQQFEELRRVRTHRNADKNGKFRWYNDYQFAERLGGGTITVRLHATDEDTKRKFNRTENVRPIPSTDPDFARLCRRRNDAESITGRSTTRSGCDGLTRSVTNDST